MSDPTPIADDPLSANGTDPDLIQDRDAERRQSPGADAENPDDGPSLEERQQDVADAEHLAHGEPDAGIA